MLTLSNKFIEEQLKGSNMWYHTNNYFQGMIKYISPSLGTAVSVGRPNFMSVINVTENEVIIIPINTSEHNKLETDKAIYLCYEDIDFVQSTSLNGSLVVNAKKNNENVFTLVTNYFFPTGQYTNFKNFVNTFQNNGIPGSVQELSSTPYGGTSQPQLNEASENAGRVVGIIFLLFFMFSALSGIVPAFFMAENLFAKAFIGMFLLVFTGVPGLLIFTLLKSNKKENLYNNNTKVYENNKKNDSYSNGNDNISYSDNIVGNDSPIFTEDEDFGGIKKL